MDKIGRKIRKRTLHTSCVSYRSLSESGVLWALTASQVSKKPNIVLFLSTLRIKIISPKILLHAKACRTFWTTWRYQGLKFQHGSHCVEFDDKFWKFEYILYSFLLKKYKSGERVKYMISLNLRKHFVYFLTESPENLSQTFMKWFWVKKKLEISLSWSQYCP